MREVEAGGVTRRAERARIVFGVRPVEELVRARPRDVNVVYVADGTRSPEIERGGPGRQGAARLRRVPPAPDGRRAGGRRRPPGASSRSRARSATRRWTICWRRRSAAGEPPLIVLLDGITDPHNLGAIVRSAEVLGAHGVVIPSRGSASVTPGAVKASAGATERVRDRRGAEPAARDRRAARGGRARAGRRRRRRRAARPRRLQAGPIALVVGAEGKGMREAVARRCDGLFHIPQRGAVVVAERFRRRRHRALRGRPPARVVARPASGVARSRRRRAA